MYSRQAQPALDLIQTICSRLDNGPSTPAAHADRAPIALWTDAQTELLSMVQYARHDAAMEVAEQAAPWLKALDTERLPCESQLLVAQVRAVLEFTYRWAVRMQEDEPLRFAITSQSACNTLAAISAAAPISHHDLAAQLHVTLERLPRYVDPLLSRDLAMRVRRQGQDYYGVTPEGTRVLSWVWPDWQERLEWQREPLHLNGAAQEPESSTAEQPRPETIRDRDPRWSFLAPVLVLLERAAGALKERVQGPLTRPTPSGVRLDRTGAASSSPGLVNGASHNGHAYGHAGTTPEPAPAAHSR